MHLSIRSYRGVQRADIELAPIALIAGVNEQGKSCVAEAVRAVLARVAVPISGIAKKDAKLLVRDGDDYGSVTVKHENVTRIIEWPRAEILGDDGGELLLHATKFAVGFSSVLDLNDRDRAAVLSEYIDTEPDFEDLAEEMRDVGYNDVAIEKCWGSVTMAGGHNAWDHTYKRARDYSSKLKGQWEEVTGERYGPKKAADWCPQDYPGPESDRDQLDEAAKAAQDAVLHAVGSAAVSKAELENLTAIRDAASEAEDSRTLENELSALTTELDRKRNERALLPAEGGPGTANATGPCPSCGAVLVIERTHDGQTILREYDENQTEIAATKEARKKRAQLDGEIENVKARIFKVQKRQRKAEQLREAAEAAEEKLAEAGDALRDEEAITTAKANAAKAQSALSAFDAKQRADELHAQIAKNDKLIEILAPEGLRRRKLQEGLALFNAQLELFSAAAGWPTVRFDENLHAHYGTRPIWAASKSGQWRARTIIQITLAKIDSSCAIVLDEADILDSRGRNQLFNAVKQSGLRALIAMTINNPDLVPNLATANIGHSYWIEGGKTREIVS